MNREIVTGPVRLCVYGIIFGFFNLLSGHTIAQDSDPGENNPIVPAARRTLFADQHGLVALPQDPVTSEPSVTFSDWLRSFNLNFLELQASFNNGLQGVFQSRAVAGQILNQREEQVAVGRFTGAANNAFNTITVDILNPDGSLEADAKVRIPAVSTDVLYDNAAIANSFSIAVGELTPLTDDEGSGHLEVVVCNFQQKSNVFDPRLDTKVTIVDYTDLATTGFTTTSAIGGPEVTRQTRPSSELNYLRRDASDSSVACAAGDVNGDGVDEIAVTFLNGIPARQWVGIFQYTNDGINPPTLEQVGEGVQLRPEMKSGFSGDSYNGSVDIAMGDFNGDGRIDIAVSSISRQNDFSTNQNIIVNFPAVRILSSDDNFNLSLKSVFIANETAFTEGLFDNTGSYTCNRGSRNACEYMRATLVSGLFRFNPNQGFDFNRRQLALVFNMPFDNGGGLRAFPLSVSDDLNAVMQLGSTQTLPQQSCSNSLCPSGQRFSVGSGGYVGSGDVDNPLWSLVVSNWETSMSGDASRQAKGQEHLFWLKALPDGSGGGFEIAWNDFPLGESEFSGPVNARLPSVAWDRQGKSLWLGAPVHLIIYDLIATEFIIQEPPKHAYWWPPTAVNPGEGLVMNISRKENFVVELSDEQNLDYSFTHKDQTDWTIGASVTTTSSASVTKGISAGILGSAKATASSTVRAQVGYDYNENKEAYESDYRSQTTTFTGRTSSDDLLIADIQLIDIWRYPVSGIEVEEGFNAFWEIAFPGESATVQAGGLVFGWYEPPHENGNILSYAPLSGSSFRPVDCCAPFTFVEGSEELIEERPFLDDRLLAYDGTAATIDLQFSEESGGGSTKSYTHSLKQSLDVNVGFKAEARVLGKRASAEVSVDTNINNSNSWSEVSTETASTNNSTGFRLEKPAGNSNQSYFFLPAFYLAEDGTTKVSYAVDILGTGATFWSETYGIKPDPALNLPRRFSIVDGTVIVNPSADAKRIRRFEVRQNMLEEADGYPLVDGAVTDGDEVRLEVEAYNYSTAIGVSGLVVAFEAVELDPESNTELDRFPINCGAGSTTILAINPLQRSKAVCVWDTSGFGPTIPGLKDYRMYVTLDPDDTIDELYNGTEGPGQNNQGWERVTVASAEETYRVPTPTDSLPMGGDVQLSETALAVEVDGVLESEFATVVRDQLTPLRVCIDTDQNLTGYYHVLIWDSDGEAEAPQLIADELVQGVDTSGDSCIWLSDFRFQRSGEHMLLAEVLETREDEQLLGNARDMLRVYVDEIPNIPLLRAKGFAFRVGSNRDNGRIRINADFAYEGNIDFRQAGVKVVDVLNEVDGAGELVPDVGEESGQELVLYPIRFNRTGAWFRTPKRMLPQISLRLQEKGKSLRASVVVKRTGILRPELCGNTTELTTRMRVLDGNKTPIDLEIPGNWRCRRNRQGEVSELKLRD